MRLRRAVQNPYEVAAGDELSRVGRDYGANILRLVRVADALPIDGSGLEPDLYAFALRAHFDFLAIDARQFALFAVELDGRQHETDPVQRARDRKKDLLCARFELPLARVTTRWLRERRNGLTMVAWLAHCFFVSRTLADAQDNGTFPADEPIDPFGLVSLSGHPARFPLIVATRSRIFLRNAFQRGQLVQPSSDGLTVALPGGECRAIEAVCISADTAVVAEMVVKVHLFGVTPSEVASELLSVDLERQVRAVLDGRRTPISLAEARARVRKLAQAGEVLSSHGSGVVVPWDLGRR